MNAKKEFEGFLEAQKVLGYKLGDITGTPEGDMIKYTELKISVTHEEEEKRKFYENRTKAFNILEEEYNSKRNILAQEWQDKENLL